MAWSDLAVAKGAAVVLPFSGTADPSGTTPLVNTAGSGVAATALNGAAVGTWDGTLPGGLSGGVRLDGANDYIALSEGSTWFTPATNGFTIETWVYIRNNTIWQRLFDFANALNTGDILGIVNFNVTNGLFSFQTGGSDAFSPANFPVGAWVHAVFTCTAAGVKTAYLDKVQWFTANGPAQVNRARANMWLGRSQYNDPYLNASLGGVAIYNRVLTLAEIAENYDAGIEPSDPPTGAPNVTAAKEFNGAVYLKWNTLAGVAGTAPSYEYRIDGGAPVDIGNVTRKTIAGLVNGTTYSVQIRGKNVVGAGPWSAPLALTPSLATIFYDDYDRAASNVSPGVPVYGGTGYTPDSYVAAGSVWGITADGKLYNVTAAERNLLTQGADSYDIDIEATITAAADIRLSDMNLFLRRNTAATTGFINISTNANALWIAYRDATAFRTIAYAPNVTWQQGDRLRVVALGPMIYAFRNGKLLVSARDTFSSPGHTGWGIRLTRGDQYIDEVTAKVPTAGMMNKNGSLAEMSPVASVPELVHVYKGRDTKAADAGSVA